MPDAEKNDGISIASLAKALRIIDEVSACDTEPTISDLTRLTGFSRGTVQRATHTLCAIDILERIAGTSTFRLGTRIVWHAYTYLCAHPLIEVAMPYLVDLNARTGVGCDFWLVDTTDVVLAAHLPDLEESEPMAEIGLRKPSLSNAVSRGVFCLSPASDQAAWAKAASKLNSADNRPPVQEDITKAVNVGFHSETGTDVPGVTSITSLITDFSGQPAAAISVSLSPGRKNDPDEIARLGWELAKCARVLSALRLRSKFDRREPIIDRRIDPGNPKSAEDQLFVAAVARGINLLDCFNPAVPSLTLTQLHKCSGFSVPMTQRLTETLTQAGYLERDPARKTYSLTAHCLDLLFGFQAKKQALKAIWPKLLHLRRVSGLRVSFCEMDGQFITHLMHLQGKSREDFRTAFVGQAIPAVSTSGGRAILSHKPDRFIDDFLNRYDVEKITPHTETDKNRIREILAEARENGFAATDEQSILGEVYAAVPVFRHETEPIGAIVVSAPKPDWTLEKLIAEVVPVMKRIV